MSIFGGNNESFYYDLLNRYAYLSGRYHHLRYKYKKEYEVFQVMARDGPVPWPGIKVHTPLSYEIYNVLIDDRFQDMIINGRIDGIKIYKDHSHKQVTFYISFHSIAGYKELLHIFREHKIDIKPELQVHIDRSESYVLLNRMYIAKNIFVRYSTDFYGDIDDKVPEKIKDSTWRAAEENWKPKILAVSRSYLWNHFYEIAHDLNHSNNTIYTFLTLKRFVKGFDEIIVPIPNIILSLSNELKFYDISTGEEDSLSTLANTISDHPKDRLYKFLESGTA